MNHIRDTSADTHSWCGEVLNGKPYFKDAESAAISGRFDGAIQTCPVCIDVIIKCLQRGEQIGQSTSEKI